MKQHTVQDQASKAEPVDDAVHIHGPDGLDMTMTPQAALETSRNIGDAAVEVLLDSAAAAAKVAAEAELQKGPGQPELS